MSGFLGQMLGSIMGGQHGGQPSAIASILQQVLASNGGGVAGLVSRFQTAGLGAQAQSWVSEGENMPVSAAPQAVNHVTPGGQIPEANATPDLSSLMSRLFGSAGR
jgi:uncharacterized protein YidB (DUF937 family)